MSSTLTDAQLALIAKNREEGLKRAAARKAREAAEALQKAQNETRPTSTSSMSHVPGSSSLPKSLLLKQQQQQLATSGTNVSLPSTYSKTGPGVPVPTPKASVNLASPLKSSSNSISAIARPSPWTVNNNVNSVTTSHRSPSLAPLPKSKVTATLKLVGGPGDRIKIVISPFHSAVVNVIKSLPSRSFDDRERIWTISLKDCRQAERILSEMKEVDVTVESIPDNVMRLLSTDSLSPVPSDLSKMIDPSLISALFPYQREGVSYGLARKGRVLIADEMGLGKSVQALTVARYYKGEWPLLIVCPSSVKPAWKTQLNNFLPIIKRITVIDKGTDPLPDARTSNTVVIMSYDQMVQKQKELSTLKYNVIIFDESHLLKDGKAKRTQVATTLSKIATRVILLSGTPALSRPAELFSQIRLVNASLFTHFQNFAIRYCDGKQGRFCFEAKGCTNSEELSAILSKRIMIRRLKADVLKDLPDKRREIVYLSGDQIDRRMDNLQRAQQMENLQKARMEFEAQGASDHDCLLRYYNMTGIVKAAAVCNHILDNYFYPDAPRRKVLIFAHHAIVLDTIEAEIQKRNLQSIRIDGATPAKERGGLCERFQNDDDILVAVLSLTAAGVGITLTAASVVVFAEIHWNPGTLLQAEDRAHRVGQKDSVFVQYLIARNTADDAIWRMVQAKLDVLGQVKLSNDTYRSADRAHVDISDSSKSGQLELPFKRQKIEDDRDPDFD